MPWPTQARSNTLRTWMSLRADGTADALCDRAPEQVVPHGSNVQLTEPAANGHHCLAPSTCMFRIAQKSILTSVRR
jgi:hypothetical protein